MGHIFGYFKRQGKTGDWHPLAATEQPDGTFILKVDTELTLDGANISINNLKVGSTDQSASNATYLKTEADGTVHVTGTLGGATLGVPKHYNATANTTPATVNFANPTKSLLIINSDVVNDLIISFEAGKSITIPSGEDISIDTAVSSLDISASVNGTPYQILTTE